MAYRAHSTDNPEPTLETRFSSRSPISFRATCARGINDHGQVVGFFDDASGRHGFEVTLPEVTGTAGTAITLGISATLGEAADADAMLSVTIKWVPSVATTV